MIVVDNSLFLYKTMVLTILNM